MSSRPAVQSRPAVARPEPMTPVGGAVVTDRAPEFVWSPIDAPATYRLQIAANASFTTTYFDAPVDDHTTITVYDVLPGHTATCYWRVQATLEDGTTVTSGVAHFVTENDPAVVSEDDQPAGPSDEDRVAASLIVPEIESPTKDAPVVGTAAVFEWTALPAARGYDLQVSRTEDFGEVLVDLDLDATTSLTLYGMMPEDGSTFFWRVRAQLPGRGRTSGWSDAVRFVATTDEAVIAYDEQERQRMDELEAMEEARRNAQAAARAEAESPVLTGTTSSALSLATAYVTVLSFAVTIYLIALAV